MKHAQLAYGLTLALTALALCPGCAHTGEDKEPRGGIVYFHGSIDTFEGKPSLGLGLTLERFGDGDAEEQDK